MPELSEDNPTRLSGERESAFHGRSAEWSEELESLAEARELIDSLLHGMFDLFLSQALERWEIRQARNPDGTFARGWKVTVWYRYPTRGESPSPSAPAG